MRLATESPIALDALIEPAKAIHWPTAAAASGSLAAPKSWPVRGWFAVCHVLEWLFGLASLFGFLAALAVIPVLNFVTLGYLLTVSGNVAQSGRLRDGFIDIFKFARIGSMVAGTWLCLLVPRLVASYATDAWLIDPTGPEAQIWRIAQMTITAVVIAHILLAWYSGGRLRHFFWPLLAPGQLAGWLLLTGPVGRAVRRAIAAVWPQLADDLIAPRPLANWFPPAILVAGIRRGRMYAQARDAVWEFLASLRLPHYFWLGARGFLGALAWLLVPCLLLMAGTSGGGPPTVLLGFLGAALLVVVVMLLPFLQTHFAAEQRFRAMFERRIVQQQFARAPLAFWLALFVTLLLALPLYLFKIEPVLPDELKWTVTLFFVALIYPARLATGWAVARARLRQTPRLFVSRWLAVAAAVPIAAFYVFVVFLSQYTSFLGPASILEQHAFLLPVPFVSL